MLKIFLNNRSFLLARHLHVFNQSLSFHLTRSSVNSQDYDISDDLTNYRTIKKKRGENRNEKFLGIVSPDTIRKKLKFYLDCTDAEVSELLKENKFIYGKSLTILTRSIEFLFEKKISTQTILENPWLLEMKHDYIEEKLSLIQTIEPMNNINDYAPLIRNSVLQIAKIKKIFKKERNDVPEGNRILYFAHKIGVEPMLVSKYFSSRMFMLEIPLDQLYENLDIMLEYKVSAQSILQDLWGFKYLPKSIRTRLERAKNGSKENLKPWMIRCPETILQRSIEITQESKDLLDGKTIVEYLAERLGYDVETLERVFTKNEQLYKLRPRTAQETLDYLMNEEGYEPWQIISVIRILCHSLETTKKRLEELKSHGCRPSSLIIVCKSQREYQKFLTGWLAQKERLEKIYGQ